MDLGIEGRVILVVSANEADLAACGDLLAAEGAICVCVDHLEGAVDTVIAEHGRLDAVIAHLSIRRSSTLLDADLEQLEEAFSEVEAVAGAYRAAARAMGPHG